MILCISDVLTGGELRDLLQTVERGHYVDGASTAGWAARGVKRNLQMDEGSPAYAHAASIVTSAIERNELFCAASFPRRLRPPLFSKSTSGMGYGNHIDDALMGNPMTRADLSFTLFLNGEDSYQGGELTLEDSAGEQQFRLSPGSMVLYPSTFLHRVEPVLAGTRLVAVGWIESLCRSAAVRELLFDLHLSLSHEFDTNGKTEQFDRLSKARSNLLRMFAET